MGEVRRKGWGHSVKEAGRRVWVTQWDGQESVGSLNGREVTKVRGDHMLAE